MDDRLHQHLGVGARDEHGGRNIQPKAVKLPLADKIGHRLARQMPRAQGIRRALDLGRGVEQPVAQKLIFRFARRGADQLARRLRRVLRARLAQAPAQVHIEVVVLDRHLPLVLALLLGNDQLHRADGDLEHTVVRLVGGEVLQPEAGFASAFVTGLSCPPT